MFRASTLSGLDVMAGVPFLLVLILAENAITPFHWHNLWNALALINCMSSFGVVPVGSGFWLGVVGRSVKCSKITLVSTQSIQGLCWTNQS